MGPTVYYRYVILLLLLKKYFNKKVFFYLFLFSRKNAKFREKVCEMQTKIFAFFRETFRSLETLM